MKYLLATLLTFCLLAACTSIFPAQKTTTPTAPDIDLDHLEPNLPIFREGLIDPSILADMDGATIYRLEFVIDKDFVHITGKEDVRYTNREDVSLNELEYRLFPNILGGKMTVSNLQVEGNAVTPTYELQNSLMIVPLPEPLAIGSDISISMDFAIEVPADVELNYGVLAYYDDVLTLAHAYPMVAVYNEEGWNAELPPQSGDVTFADASFFLVSVTAPKGVTIVASGLESEPVTSGRQIVQNVAVGPARDFFLAVSKDFDVVSETVGGITINSYAPKKWRDVSQSMVDTAFRAIETFSNQFSPYPYTEFDIVATPNLALGIEYPGATAITYRLYTDETFGSQTGIYRESTVAHEVGHQWFYNLVGNDQLDEPWLDESLTQFITWEYYRINYGSAGASGFESGLRGRWERVDNAPIPIGQPVATYVDREYGAIVYGRGAFFFEALREEMGATVFDAFISDYTLTFAWKIASAKDLKALAEKHCNCDLSPIFEKWVFP